MLIPYSNIKIKAYLQILKKLVQFFAYPLFQILKKHSYKFWKTWRNFLLILIFKFKKSALTNFKNPGAIFYLSPISNIKKNTLFIIKILKEIIYIKTIIQISKYKAKYIITACIPKITIKNFYFFLKKIYNYIKKISSPCNYKKRFFSAKYKNGLK